jgi:hypothetical protein
MMTEVCEDGGLGTEVDGGDWRLVVMVYGRGVGGGCGGWRVAGVAGK